MKYFKGHVFLLIILLFQNLYLMSQAECTRESMNKLKGRWVKKPDENMLAGQDQHQVITRIDNLQKIVQSVIAQPMGMEIDWERNMEGINLIKNGSLPFELAIKVGLFYCEHGTNKILANGVSNTGLYIKANSFEWFLRELENIVIENRPIYLLPRKTGELKGLPVYEDEPQNAVMGPPLVYTKTSVVVRKGSLPYMPVSKKEYLEAFISFHEKEKFKSIKDAQYTENRIKNEDANRNKKHDEIMRIIRESNAKRNDTSEATRQLIKKMEVEYQSLAKLEDQEKETRPDLIELESKKQNDVLQPARDAFQKLGEKGSEIAYLKENYTEQFIGFGNEGNGQMVVRLNSSYFKGNLPKYVPQLLIIRWSWGNWQETTGWKNQLEQINVSELQDMLDK